MWYNHCGTCTVSTFRFFTRLWTFHLCHWPVFFFFFGLCLISVRPLVNLLVALQFAAVQLKVLFWWSAFVLSVCERWKKNFQNDCTNLNTLACFHCCSSMLSVALSLSFSYLIVLVSVRPWRCSRGEEWMDLWGVSIKGPPGLLRAVC